MKVNKRLRDLYEEGNNRYSRLATEVRDMLKPLVEQKGWFFTWRLKELESFALKIETGRVSNPVALEDFFACTIVLRSDG